MDDTSPPKPGVLFLVPCVIAPDTQDDVIGHRVREELRHTRYFLAENIRTARRYLKSLGIYDSIENLQFEVLDKDTPYADMKELLRPLHEGSSVGILSESGCPGIADPGALAVKYAHEKNIKVVPLVGPSSLLLALMGSGLNGQRFAFHGYLPVEPKESTRVIRELEKESRARNQSQLFIETPYRSNTQFRTLLESLRDDTLLCAAVNLTSSSERIQTKPVREWKLLKSEIPKEPAVFLFLAK